MSRVIALFMCVLVLVVPLTALAQAAPPTPIAYGDTVEGEITADESLADGLYTGDLYQFTGSAGDTITIAMNRTDEELDTRLVLYTAANWETDTNSTVAENDDMRRTIAQGEWFLDSEIVTTLPEDGEYIIVATSFSREELGSYRLSLTEGGTPPVTQDAPPPVAVGEPLVQFATGATATSQYGDDNWSAQQATGEPNTFECGDIVTAWASATSTGVDTLELTYDQAVMPMAISIFQTYNPGSITSVEVANSTSGESLVLPNSADPPENTPCPGAFMLTGLSVPFAVDTIRVNVDQTIGGNWNEIDAVQLVGMPEGATTAAPGTVVPVQSIAYGVTVESEIAADELLANSDTGEAWQFEGSAGDDVTITMNSAEEFGLDTRLLLFTQADYDAGNPPFAENDDMNRLSGEGESGLDSEIVTTLPEDGTYIIGATSFTRSATGAYSLRLEKTEMIEAVEDESATQEPATDARPDNLVVPGEPIDVAALFEQTETFEAAFQTGGTLLIEYPADWFMSDTPDGPGLASSEELGQLLLDNEDYALQDGEYGLRFLPLGNDGSISDAQMLFDAIMGGVDTGEDDATVGAQQEETMGAYDVIFAPVVTETENDGFFAVIDIDDAYVVIAALSSEPTEGLEDIMREIITRLTASGTDGPPLQSPGG